KKWLETFTGIDYDNRLPRGRSYANTGRAYDIKIQANIITAKVQGSRPKSYAVKVILKPFNQMEKEFVRNIIVSSPSILSALINKKLPSLLLEKLNEHKIHLFPSNWKKVEASCSCPDWAMPCKHIAAVIYLICAEIDKNPFVVFRIHDCDLLSLIGDFSEGKLERVQKIDVIEDIFKPCKKDFQFDQSILDTINFSKIPDLSGYIITMLRNDPSFYKKNFREILHLAYKHWQRYPDGKMDQGFYSHPMASKTKKELTEKELFTEKWQYPEQWRSFNLAVDDNHQLTGVFNKDVELFSNSKNLILILVRFLEEIPNAILHKLCSELCFAHLLLQFSVKLMEKSAFIPQILQNKKGETLIRWLPALFDQDVRQVYHQLCSSCPKDLVKYKKAVLNPEEQVKTAVAMILSGLMEGNLPTSLDKNISQDVFQLFFLQKSYKFTEFTNKELPAAINQWLYNLYISEREHKFYLMVEDKDGEFELELQLSLGEKKAPISLQKVLKASSPDIKLAILSDLSMISEYIPELECGFDNGVTTSFALDAFTPLFLRILPVLKAIGVRVILPKSLQKILKPQLSLRLKSKDKTKNDCKSFLNLKNLLDFDWQIAIGDKNLSLIEFKKMIK
ncbi:MAG: SNF2 helicase-associated domain-containing protein, partial [Verrucomicrobiota bacterium]